MRERFLAAFEGMLTPIEGRIAAAETLIDPHAAPAPMLPALAAMLGQNLPAHWPESRRRRLLAQTGQLQRRRGTYAGVCLALDILTDGALARGEIVVVENFRLRRTMATLLGIDMDDRHHPLTLGTAQSGNSIVGDSLILSEEDARAFLALFDPELARIDERAAVRAFFDRYSHQVSVLLHGPARALHQAVAEQLRRSMPAHLQWRILETDHPFVLGLAPLLMVDTFLEAAPPPARVTLDATYLGREGLLRNPVAFSPEDINARPIPP
ncbi:MAG: urease accessory protein UreD [Pseudolabrys sp.]